MPKSSLNADHYSGAKLYQTKGLKRENDPNRDCDGADGRRRVAAEHSVGGAGSEYAARIKSKGAVEYDERKVIMLIEARIQPQRRAELVEAARQYLPLVRAEPGVEAFYVTARTDDPNTFIFYEIYRSQAAQDFHLQQELHQEIPGDVKERAGRRPSADKSPRAALGRTDTSQLGALIAKSD